MKKSIIFTIIILAAAAAFIAAAVPYLLTDRRETLPENEQRSDASAEGRTAIPESGSRGTLRIEAETEPLPAASAELQPTAPAEPQSIEISLLFAGDILLDPSYAVMAAALARGGDSYAEGMYSPELLDLMRSADLFMVNNEFPYSSGGSPTEGKQYTFRARPEYVSILSDMGVDLVSLANNHAYDYGQAAFIDTMDILDEAGIPRVGGGHDIEEASAAYIYEADGMKIGILSATQIERTGSPDTRGATEDSPGVFRCMSPDRLVRRISELKEQVDLVIVYVHWGTESKEEIDSYQRDQAPLYAAAGADVIIGDHPHILQKIDRVGDCLVFYSMGNYLFNSKTQDSGLAEITVDTETKKIVSSRFIPTLQSGCRASLMTGTEKQRVIGYMNGISGVHMDEEGYIID